MMTEQEHCLTVLMEECSEVVKAASKAKRFGLTHFWEKEGMTNAEAITMELRDVFFMMERCVELGLIKHPLDMEVNERIAKRKKFDATLEMSRRLGTVAPKPAPLAEDPSWR